ncbi:hypothetical protein ATY75_12005 [Rhizobium sp. N122]|uniref:hypothetical protein n=1 Tax=Rhizobium sp. N122 TaxID=1764272 RepID=UPI000B5A5160|nr:hypothetical protein [Rhizobium sp. N122]OWV62542.1 hypothetical protein ATY75_12005 [Rhizobium sp. N122]
MSKLTDAADKLIALLDPYTGLPSEIRLALIDLVSANEQEKHADAKLETWAKQITTAISDAIGGGSEMFLRHGDIYRIDPVFVAEYIRERRKDHHEAMHRHIRHIRELEAQIAVLGANP